MPIIIWGSRGLTSHLDRGRFYCPECDRECDYALDQVREWFTLYFIPLFPIGGAKRYVECRSGGNAFTEEVLDSQPPSGEPSEGEQLKARLYREMEDGLSLEDAETRLRDMGLEGQKAFEIVRDMGRGDNWACQTCGQHYLNAVRSCRRCKGV